jgi:CHAT domain-containing protein
MLPTIVSTVAALRLAAQLAGAPSFDVEPIRIVFEKGPAACSSCALDAQSKPTAEVLADLRMLQGKRQVRVTALSIGAAQVSGDEATATITVRLDIAENPDAGAWRETRDRHFTASFRRAGAAWALRTLASDEDAFAAQLVAVPRDEAQRLLAEHAALVNTELVQALLRRAFVILNTTGAGTGEVHGELALAIARKVGDRSAEALATSLQSTIARSGGKIDLAEELVGQALAIAHESGDPDAIARSYVNLARIQSQRGLGEAREASLLEARKFGRRAVDPTLQIRALEGLAGRRLVLGDYADARGFYDEVLRLSEEAGDVPAQITSQLGLSSIYDQQHDIELSLHYAKRALELAKQTRSRFLRGAEVRVAKMRIEYGERDEAEAILTRILAEPRPPGFEIAPIVQGSLILSDIYLRRGDAAGAECLARDGDAISRAHGKPSITLHELCRDALERGQTRRALALALEQAAYNSTYRSGTIRALIVAGRAYGRLGMAVEGRSCLTEAIEIHDEMMRNMTGPQDQQVAPADEAAPAYRELVASYVTSDPWEAFAYAERGRGRILTAHRRRDATPSSRMSAAEREEERVLSERLAASNVKLAAATPANAAERDALLREQLDARMFLRAFHEQLYARNPLAKDRSDDVRGLAGELSPGMLFCAYTVAEDAVFLFVLDPSSSGEKRLTTHRLPVSGSELRERVELFSRRLSTRDLKVHQSSRDLFELLLAPVAGKLARREVLVVAPDGPLWKVPFAALSDRSGKYVVEATAVSYTPSLQVLVELERAHSRPRERTLLAVGNPSLDKSFLASAKSLYRGIDLGPLPAAETEVEKLGAIYGRSTSTLLTGADAIETEITRAAPSHAILHFATHGIFDDGQPMYSRLLLARNTTGDDGFLEAWEIANSRLDADLVVLAACDTARGRESDSEGLVGMTWAFFVAGARSVVSAQWKVQSEVASRMMVEFHEQLHERASSGRTARALRQAQLTMIRDRRFGHPYYWAPYSLVGATRIGE